MRQTMVFNNVGHLLNGDMLKWQFQRLDGKKAVGIDGVTKEAYAENLMKISNISSSEIRKGTYQPACKYSLKFQKKMVARDRLQYPA